MKPPRMNRTIPKHREVTFMVGHKEGVLHLVIGGFVIDDWLPSHPPIYRKTSLYERIQEEDERTQN